MALSFEITLKLYLFGKYSTQTMIFWSLCAFIWFRNMKQMLLQMTSVSLQPVPSLHICAASPICHPDLKSGS
jgi:hypothetical protein